MCFGSTGMFEQDDVENWVSLTNTAGGSMARQLLLNGRMGLLADDTPVVDALPPERFHGPGTAQVGYNENNQRAILRMWADHLELPRWRRLRQPWARTASRLPLVQTNGTPRCEASVKEAQL